MGLGLGSALPLQFHVKGRSQNQHMQEVKVYSQAVQLLQWRSAAEEWLIPHLLRFRRKLQDAQW